MTDNARDAYTKADAFQACSDDHRHPRASHCPPYTPRWNGKVERFIQTLRERMGVRPRYRGELDTRHAQAVKPYWSTITTGRDHTATRGQPPLSRVHNVCGSYI